MESEPEKDSFVDDAEPYPLGFPAYMERWDGRRMIANNYYDPFEAEKDPFIEGLEGHIGEQEMGRGETMVSPESTEERP